LPDGVSEARGLALSDALPAQQLLCPPQHFAPEPALHEVHGAEQPLAHSAAVQTRHPAGQAPLHWSGVQVEHSGVQHDPAPADAATTTAPDATAVAPGPVAHAEATGSRNATT